MGYGGFIFFVWLLLYGGTTLVTRHFASLGAWVLPLGQLLNTLLLIGWLRIRREQRLLFFRADSMTLRKRDPADALYLLPSVCQLVYFGIQTRTMLNVFCILLVVVQEEILFRGILLRSLCRFGRMTAVILSGIAFAAAHLLNPAGEAGWNVLVYQFIYAVAAGIALSALSLTEDGLISCIIIHFVNNLTSIDAPVMTPGYMPWFWLCVLIYFACGIRRMYLLNKPSSGGEYQ